MSFIDSYKRLEKLCSEIYSENNGLSVYIDEMINNPNGSYYVPGWEEDLKQLKHYRWKRNKIVHEPGCTEENMCVPEDSKWLDSFYLRIMSANDPLALYRKERVANTVQRSKHKCSPEPTSFTCSKPQKVSQKPVGCIIYLICCIIIVVVALLLLLLYYFM